jgi:plasmid stability protein
MADVLVRDVPQEILEILKRRAAENRRSLQQELLLLLEEAARKENLKAIEAAAQIRERLAGYGRTYADSTGLIREDRER